MWAKNKLVEPILNLSRCEQSPHTKFTTPIYHNHQQAANDRNVFHKKDRLNSFNINWIIPPGMDDKGDGNKIEQ